MKTAHIGLSLLFGALLGIGVPQDVTAQESLSVTVTPPMIQLTIGPGETWASSLKVVNTNSYDLAYYAAPVDFEAEGEEGKGTFKPLPGDATSLGSWIEISRDPFLVPRGTSMEIPFTVRIPESASPGGQYAAILIGTTPGDDALEGPTVRVASYVSSLLFVRIKGDIDERARIREFRSEEWFLQESKATFALRFENTGNTHLRPQGEIVLYNMWGKERGRVQLTQKSAFGNVLPMSIRRFSFAWEGEKSLFDIGRYSAIVTLSYGEEQKQNTSAVTYFWVVPVVPVAVTLGGGLLLAFLIAWLIRRYIRRAVAIERERFGGIPVGTSHATIQTLMRPLRDGAVDLRAVAGRESETQLPVSDEPQQLTLFGFLQKYSLFFFFLTVILAASWGIWMYFDSVLLPEREFTITEVSAEEEMMSE